MLRLLAFLLTVQQLAANRTWSGDFDNFPTSWGVTKISNRNLTSIVKDPFNSSVNVLRIEHPKGSCSDCGIPSGAMFGMNPFANFSGNVATLTYEVFFHETFNFVKGGKLPGISGGGSGCSGCNTNVTVRDNCFSARFMWGHNGKGYPYLYLPLSVQHNADFCSNLTNFRKCNGTCGWDFMPSQYFTRNKWTEIKSRFVLNTPGQKNGSIEVWIDGVKRIEYNQMIYRTKSTVGIIGFIVHPFFGGGEDWATPVDTYTMYKNFKFSDF